MVVETLQPAAAITSPIPIGPSSHSPRFQLLLAPAGQLSGDGQLREQILERLNRTSCGTTPPSAIWFLPHELMQQLEPELKLELGSANQVAQEGLLTEDAAVHVWLQLRFGGGSASPFEIALITPKLGRSWLEQQATDLPPTAPQAPLTLEEALA